MGDDELLETIEAQRGLMIAVATGTPIREVEADYEARRYRIRKALDERGLKDPNSFDSLWVWYGKWRSGDLPSYQSRRMFLYELYAPLLEQVRQHAANRGVAREVEPTGWTRVDRGIEEARNRLAAAQNEEQYQAVGHLCREILISLAQTVFDPELHPTPDGVAASETDAKRMLEAYIGYTLGGGSAGTSRRHARAAVDLANEVQHRRTATFREAALCAEATTSVINLIAIISGRRDP
jgi:hypothetical protein